MASQVPTPVSQRTVCHGIMEPWVPWRRTLGADNNPVFEYLLAISGPPAFRDQAKRTICPRKFERGSVARELQLDMMDAGN